jgi:hypothetical protein
MNLSSLSGSGYITDYIDSGATITESAGSSGVLLNVTGERGVFSVRKDNVTASGSVKITIDGVEFTLSVLFSVLSGVDFDQTQTMAYRNSLKVEVISLSAGTITVTRLS